MLQAQMIFINSLVYIGLLRQQHHLGYLPQGLVAPLSFPLSKFSPISILLEHHFGILWKQRVFLTSACSHSVVSYTHLSEKLEPT